MQTIYRVYFNVASSKLEEDPSVLHNKIDDLEFQIYLKDTSTNVLIQENNNLRSQNKGLRLVINATCIYTTDVVETTL